MLESRGESHLGTAIEAKAGRVEVRRSDVTSQGAGGVAHGDAPSSAFVTGLRIEDRIPHALGANDHAQEEEQQGPGSLPWNKTRKDYLHGAKIVLSKE